MFTGVSAVTMRPATSRWSLATSSIATFPPGWPITVTHESSLSSRVTLITNENRISFSSVTVMGCTNVSLPTPSDRILPYVTFAGPLALHVLLELVEDALRQQRPPARRAEDRS